MHEQVHSRGGFVRRYAWMVLLLLAPSAAGGPWHVPGGDPESSGSFDITGPVDVVATMHLTRSDERLALASQIIDTPHGLVAIAVEPTSTGQCSVIRVPPSGERVTLVGPLPCQTGEAAEPDIGLHHVLGYHAPSNRIAVCLDTLESEPLWLLNAETGDVAARIGAGEGPWICRAGGWHPETGVLCVPFARASGGGIVATIDVAAAEIEWQRPLAQPTYVFAPGTEGAAPTPYHPVACQSTTTGYGVTSVRFDLVTFSSNTRGTDVALALYGANGTFRAAVSSEIDDVVTGDVDTRIEGRVPWLTTRPVANDATLALLFGQELLLADPTTDAVTSLRPDVDAWHGTLLGPGTWVDNQLVLPTMFGAVVADSAGAMSRWDDPYGYRVEQIGTLSDGRVLVLGRSPTQPAELYLQIVDMQSKTVHQHLRLPITTTDSTYQVPRYSAGMVGMDGQILIFEHDGATAVVVGPARHDFQIATSHAYPAVREAFQLAFPRHDAQQVEISWGDGTVSWLSAADVAQHRYVEAKDHVVSVTLHSVDGTTRTAQITIHAGQHPAEELNVFQRAFARENQDLTFGLLGVGLTLFGFAVAAAVRVRYRSRLDRHLQALTAWRRSVKQDLYGAVPELAGLQQRIVDDLRRGRITDGQFAMLELEIHEAAQGIRRRILGRFTGRLSNRFEDALDQALYDGHMDEDEVKVLSASLRQETGLDAKEKEAVRLLLDRLLQASAHRRPDDKG